MTCLFTKHAYTYLIAAARDYLILKKFQKVILFTGKKRTYCKPTFKIVSVSYYNKYNCKESCVFISS